MSDEENEAPKKSLGKILRGLVFETDEDEHDEEERPKAKPAPKAAAPAFVPAASLPAVAGSADVDPAFADMLDKQTGIAAKPAFCAFNTMNETLRAAVPDEMTRLRAAMAAILPQGHTYERVVFDLDECLQVIDAREAEVRTASQTKLQEKLSGLESQAGQLQKQIGANDAEIARLQLASAELERQRQTVLGSVNSEKEKILAKTASLLATINAARAKWTAVKNRILTIAPSGARST